MHQVKTQSSRREPQAEMTSSKASIRRKTVDGKEQYHENAKTNTKELGKLLIFYMKFYLRNSENLTTLLSELQKEFAELATSCRQTEYVII